MAATIDLTLDNDSNASSISDGLSKVRLTHASVSGNDEGDAWTKSHQQQQKTSCIELTKKYSSSVSVSSSRTPAMPSNAMIQWSLQTLQHFRQSVVNAEHAKRCPTGISVLHVQKLLESMEYCLQTQSSEANAVLLESFCQAIQHCQSQLQSATAAVESVISQITPSNTKNLQQPLALVMAVRHLQKSVIQFHQLYHARIFLLVLHQEVHRFGLLLPAYQSAILRPANYVAASTDRSNTFRTTDDKQEGTENDMISLFDESLIKLLRLVAHACRFHAGRILHSSSSMMRRQNDEDKQRNNNLAQRIPAAKALKNLLSVVRACWNTLGHEWPLLNLEPKAGMVFQLCEIHLRKFLSHHHVEERPPPRIIDIREGVVDHPGAPSRTAHDKKRTLTRENLVDDDGRQSKKQKFEGINQNPLCWEQKLGLLKKYKEEYGHCLVPVQYNTTDGVSLGRWVDCQRQAMKCMLEGSPGARRKLTAERIDALNKLGFVWKLKSGRRPMKFTL